MKKILEIAEKLRGGGKATQQEIRDLALSYCICRKRIEDLEFELKKADRKIEELSGSSDEEGS